MKFSNIVIIFAACLIEIVENSQYISGSRENHLERVIGGYRPEKQIIAKHIVSLRYGNDDGIYGSNHFCGGSIITERTILTAAHCIYLSSGQYRKAELITVVAGNSRRLVHLSSERSYKVRKIIPYPLFNPTTGFGDLALLQVSKIDEDYKNIQRVPLADKDAITGENCMFLGWGKILFNGPLPDELVYVNVTILPLNECKKFVNISKGIICGGEIYYYERTAGRGDSGGPLICDGNVQGIASYIIPIRTYFTSVYNYRQWIIENNASKIRCDFLLLSVFTVFIFSIKFV